MTLPVSKLTRHQKKTFSVPQWREHGRDYRATITIRYDDQCGNGHNTFAITADVESKSSRGGRWTFDSCGCCHEMIARRKKSLAHLIKWHLMNSDGPTYYVENTLYHMKEVPAFQGNYHFRLEDTNIRIVDEAGKTAMTEKYGENAEFVKCLDFPSKRKAPDLEAARNTAIWPDAQPEDFTREKLEARLPALVAEFKQVVESLGFEF